MLELDILPLAHLFVLNSTDPRLRAAMHVYLLIEEGELRSVWGNFIEYNLPLGVIEGVDEG